MIDRHLHHAAADTRTAAQTAERRVRIISATAQQRRHRSNGNNLFHIHSHPLPQGRLKRPAKSLNKRVLYRKRCEMGDWGRWGIIWKILNGLIEIRSGIQNVQTKEKIFIY